MRSQNVTGPSFVNWTCIIAPNSPQAMRPCALRAACTNASNSCRPSSGVAAGVKLGRVPLRVSAASVNCGTASSSPPMSRRLRFIFPSASAKTR